MFTHPITSSAIADPAMALPKESAPGYELERRIKRAKDHLARIQDIDTPNARQLTLTIKRYIARYDRELEGRLLAARVPNGYCNTWVAYDRACCVMGVGMHHCRQSRCHLFASDLDAGK